MSTSVPNRVFHYEEIEYLQDLYEDSLVKYNFVHKTIHNVPPFSGIISSPRATDLMNHRFPSEEKFSESFVRSFFRRMTICPPTEGPAMSLHTGDGTRPRKWCLPRRLPQPQPADPPFSLGMSQQGSLPGSSQMGMNQPDPSMSTAPWQPGGPSVPMIGSQPQYSSGNNPSQVNTSLWQAGSPSIPTIGGQQQYTSGNSAQMSMGQPDANMNTNSWQSESTSVLVSGSQSWYSSGTSSQMGILQPSMSTMEGGSDSFSGSMTGSQYQSPPPQDYYSSMNRGRHSPTPDTFDPTHPFYGGNGTHDQYGIYHENFARAREERQREYGMHRELDEWMDRR